MAVAQKTGIPKWNPGKVEPWTKTCGLPLLYNCEPLPREQLLPPEALVYGVELGTTPVKGAHQRGLANFLAAGKHLVPAKRVV